MKKLNNISENEIKNIASKILDSIDESNDTSCNNFLNEYRGRIDELFFNDLHVLDMLYLFGPRFDKRKIINDIVEKYIDTKNNKYVYDNVEKLFEIRQKIYFSEIVIKIYKMLVCGDVNISIEYEKRKIIDKFVYEYMSYKKYNRNDRELYLKSVFEIYCRFPNDLKICIDDCVFMSKYTYRDFIEYYKNRAKRFSENEQVTNKQLKFTVKSLSDRIIDMYANNFSLNKIQRILTDECIKNNIIPEYVFRLSRKQNDRSKVEKVPALLPMSEIKNIIENNFPMILRSINMGSQK